MDFYSLVKEAVTKGASDIHIASGNHPAYRLHGNAFFTNDPALNEAEVTAIIKAVLNQSRFETFIQTGEADAAVEIGECGRFRANAFRQRNGTSLVLRVINSVVPELSTLSLPNSIRKTLDLNSGLVLMCGPTGSGKSTTLASMVQYINKNKSRHIITVEDPIEYVYPHNKAMIHQREVGKDVKSFATALRSALREDPDIILVGEMRDFETISAAITAAETGHLVLSTLHTTSAAQTVERVIDATPLEGQDQIRTQFSNVIRGVITQCLLPAADGNGRHVATEIMVANAAIGNLIREKKTIQIPSSIQGGRAQGMHLLNDDLASLVHREKITKEEAMKVSNDPASLDKMC